VPGLFGSTCASRPSGLGRRYKTRLERRQSGNARVGCGSAASVTRRFRADVGAHLDPALVDAFVTVLEDALAMPDEHRGAVPRDAPKVAT
jgi:hypothetical protein